MIRANESRWIFKQIILNSSTRSSLYNSPLNFYLHTRTISSCRSSNFSILFNIFFYIFPKIENHSLELPHHWSSWRPTNSLQPRKEPRSPVSINLFQFWHKLVTSDDKHWPRCERTPSTSYQPSPGGVYVLISIQGNGRVVLTSNSLKTKSSKPIVDYFMGYIWWWNDDASVSLWEEIFFRGIEDVLWELFSFIHVYICMYISKLILFLKLFKDN